jgi:CheY-like chemotaxis protein
MQSSHGHLQISHQHAIKNVLLVDDTPGDIALTRRALARVGHTVHLEVLQSRDAIVQRIADQDANSQAAFDLILVDMNMSRVDGHELVSVLRRNPLTSRTPLVAISTSREEAEVLHCYDIGASSFIHKAFDFTEYAQTLYEVCSYWLNQTNLAGKTARSHH